MIRAYLVSLLLFVIPMMAQAEPELPDQPDQKLLHDLLALRIEAMKSVGKTSILVDATRQQNNSSLTPDEILTIDKEWQAGTSPKIAEVEDTRATKYLKSLIKRMSHTYSEAFIADIQGATVAAYPTTSDYWQGDEQPFIQAFNNGQGAVYVGTAKLDESTGEDEVKVAVPVIDEDQVIGVLVMAVTVSAIEAQQIRDLKTGK